MRVMGNSEPALISIEKYPADRKKMDIRIRENIQPVEVTGEDGTETFSGYEYDEYRFIIKDRPNLKKDIEDHFADWLTVGRESEVDPRSTLYLNAKKDAVDEYTETLMMEGVL